MSENRYGYYSPEVLYVVASKGYLGVEVCYKEILHSSMIEWLAAQIHSQTPRNLCLPKNPTCHILPSSLESFA